MTLREVVPHSFIYEIAQALPRDVCREMIRRFEERADQQYPGRIGTQQSREASIKKTTDLFISAHADWKDIDGVLRQSLGTALREVAREFPFFAVNRFKDIGYNLQRYLPGEFYHWHVDSGPGEFMTRPGKGSSRGRKTRAVSAVLDPYSPRRNGRVRRKVHRHHLGVLRVVPCRRWSS